MHVPMAELLEGCSQVFRYGVSSGRCEPNPAADLRGALKPVMPRHMSAILEPVELRLGEISVGQHQDLVGLAQFAHLALKLLDALLLGRRRSGANAAVALALAHPLAQRLARAADLGRDRLDRRKRLGVTS